MNTLGELRGTMAYCPPEIYDGGLYSFRSDVYSIGMVLFFFFIFQNKILNPII